MSSGALLPPSGGGLATWHAATHTKRACASRAATSRKSGGLTGAPPLLRGRGDGRA